MRHQCQGQVGRNRTHLELGSQQRTFQIEMPRRTEQPGGATVHPGRKGDVARPGDQTTRQCLVDQVGRIGESQCRSDIGSSDARVQRHQQHCGLGHGRQPA
ncbi:Uncharacterised protein [Mycobacteroides abscessus subsp. abscessus]|nr:Uncharacterised protein [Mycobacteroides abscessus subsp. abscessus]